MPHMYNIGPYEVCNLCIDSLGNINISQISALPGNTADIYTDTKNRYEEKSVLPGYLHLVVQNSIFTCLLSSSGQEWQFHMSTDILWPRMAIAHV